MRKPAPVLITDVAESPEREFRRREIRYILMMAVRALCLIAAAVVFSTRPPLWGLWMGLCLVGMVVVPWLAVVIANDRPPKTRAERAAAAVRHGPPAIAAPPHPRIIDSDNP